MRGMRILGCLFVLATLLPVQALAGSHRDGQVFLIKNVAGVIKPCFRFAESADDPYADVWRDFGLVGDIFAWNVATNQLGLLEGESAVVDFTYVEGNGTCPGVDDHVKGTHKATFLVDRESTVVIMVGGDLRAVEVAGPDERGR